MTDEEWVANMPGHLLKGYLGLAAEDIHEADEGDDDEDYEEDVAHDDAEIDGDEDSSANEDYPATRRLGNQLKSLAQVRSLKSDGHLHETDMRVDPPLTDEGKKSIALAEKQLEEAKKDYDVKKAKAQEEELKFHAAARVSKAAREERAKAEDRYYIASKSSRKAARYAENMEREQKSASARQAAHDKYAEVIAAANRESTAKETMRKALAQMREEEDNE